MTPTANLDHDTASPEYDTEMSDIGSSGLAVVDPAETGTNDPGGENVEAKPPPALEAESPEEAGTESASSDPVDELVDTVTDDPESRVDEMSGETAEDELEPDSELAEDESSASAGDEERRDESESTPEDQELARLRTLLFSREIDLLGKIQHELNDRQVTMARVSDVLAEAIHLQEDSDPRLAMAMQPLVDNIVKASMNTRRKEFVNILAPLMGPTIRKSIAESFDSMMESFSKSVEMAFSWKGLRWRLQALRSGKPFSEIVMLNTLVYRVEQLFFIHNETGLVLAHMTGESVQSQDPEMVSAMLTAIRDFVRDCFVGDQKDALHSLQMGEFTIRIETGPHAYLACVLRGTPPSNFSKQLRASLDLMHVEFADALENFKGDSKPFEEADRYLEPCMQARYVTDGKKHPIMNRLIPLFMVLAILAGIGSLIYRSHRAKAKASAAVAAAAARQEAFTTYMGRVLEYLRAEPGLLVANVAEKESPPWDILVLQDGLARSPDDVMRELGVKPELFSTRVVPFVSYHPSIVVRRVMHSVRPPETVRMNFENGVLTFSGTAPMAWIVSTREEARAIPGVERVDVSGVRDPNMDRINAMIADVEKTVIEFPLGKDTPVGADATRLNRAVSVLVELEKIAKSMGFTASLTIYGHADAVGDPKRNYEISQARARTVAGLLYGKGSSMPVAIYGMGAEYAQKGETGRGEDQSSRRIELRVHFSLSPSASPDMFR